MQLIEVIEDLLSAFLKVYFVDNVNNAWLIAEEPLVALLCQVLLNLSKIILILSAFDIAVVQDWNLHIVVVIFLLHFEVFARHVHGEEENDKVENVVLLAVQELFISGLQNFNFFRVTVFSPFFRVHYLVRQL